MSWAAAVAYVVVAAGAAAVFVAADHQARLRPIEVVASMIVGAAWPVFVLAWAAERAITWAARVR